MLLGLLGNPENRRVTLFLEACQAMGLPAPRVLAWERFANTPEALNELVSQIDLLRIDSPGENALVASRLIELGDGPKNIRLRFGQLGYLREFHRGFCLLLDHIAECGVRCMNDAQEIKTMFDKWESHLRFAAAGLKRPNSQLAPNSLEAFRATLDRSGRIFLKPLHGSSAAGVCAFRWDSKRRQLIGPIEIADDGLFNSLRIHSYESVRDIDMILGELLPQGMIQEDWIAKAAVEGGRVDLRVLVIGGEARHCVVRQSHSPMTNLHLGNRRCDLDLLRSAFDEEVIQDCLVLAERAAACFPASLYSGVDILLNQRGTAMVGEINAFGDLLPGLIHRGETTSSAILAAAGRCLADGCKKLPPSNAARTEQTL